MSVDLRRFEYALEPVRRQRQWKLDALRAELGRVQRDVDAVEQGVEGLRAQLREGARAAQALQVRPDPMAYPRALAWLVRQREAIASAQERLRTLRDERERLGAECIAQQRRVDLIERHRDECVAEFAQAEGARLASEADRDWLARQGHGAEAHAWEEP